MLKFDVIIDKMAGASEILAHSIQNECFLHLEP